MTRVLGRSPRSVVAAEMLNAWMWQHRRIAVLMLGCLVAGFALAALGRAEQARSVLSMLAFFGPLVVGVLSTSGIVADEADSGLVLMWVQKAGSLTRGYLTRYRILLGLVVSFGFVIGFSVGAVGVAFSFFTVAKAARVALCTAALAALATSIVFALSCWRVRRDSAIAIIVIVGSITLGAGFAFDDGPLAAIVKALAFPIDPIQAIVEWPTYGPLPRPIAIIVGQLALWNLAAVVGLKRTDRALS